MQVNYARFTREVTYGTYQASAPGTDIFIPRIPENGLSAEPDPQIEENTYYDGHNIPGDEYTDRTGFGGTLRFPMYPGFESVLNYGFVPVSDILNSFTLDYFDGIEVRRYLGCRVRRARLGNSTQQNSRTLMCEYQIVAQSSGTPPTFTEPTGSAYPVGQTPYSFGTIAGNVLLGGAVLTNISSVEVVCENSIWAPFDELATISGADYMGRSFDININFKTKTNAQRVDFEAQTGRALQVGWSVATPHSITFTIGTAKIRTRTNPSPMRQNKYQQVNFRPLRDGTTYTDVTLATV